MKEQCYFCKRYFDSTDLDWHWETDGWISIGSLICANCRRKKDEGREETESERQTA